MRQGRLKERCITITAFGKGPGGNEVRPGAAAAPQVLFWVTEQAAQEILDSPSDEVGQIGVEILKKIVSSDKTRRIRIQLKSGGATLLMKGYFGVIATGGVGFAAFLASRGLGGVGAIKRALTKLKDSRGG